MFRREVAVACTLTIFGWSVLEVLEVLSDDAPRDLDVLEVFSVSTSIVRCAHARGLSADSFDYTNNHQADVLTPHGFFQATKMVLRLRLSQNEITRLFIGHVSVTLFC